MGNVSLSLYSNKLSAARPSDMSKRKKSHKRSHPPTPKKISIRVMLIAAFLLLLAIAGYYVISTPKTVDLWIRECRVKVEIADTPELLAK